MDADPITPLVSARRFHLQRRLANGHLVKVLHSHLRQVVSSVVNSAIMMPRTRKAFLQVIARNHFLASRVYGERTVRHRWQKSHHLVVRHSCLRTISRALTWIILVPAQPVPPVPGNLVIPSGSIPRPPPSPPIPRGKFRKSSKNKQAPPVPAKDPGDDIFLDTNFDSLDGIVDSSRLGADSRVSFTHDGPSSTTLHGATDDTPVPHQNNHNQTNGIPPPSQPPPPPPPPPQALRQRQRPSAAPKYDPMASTESWDFLHAAATGATLPGYPPSFSAAPFNAAAFTNPFAGSSASLAQRKKPQPLRIGSSSPTNRPLPLVPPSSSTLDPNDTNASGGFPGTVSPTDMRPNDPASPSWVAPESWGVKRMSADEDAGSISGESENLEMTEPIRHGVSIPAQDDENDQSLQGHSLPGRQHSMQASGVAEYKIRVLQEVETMASPHMVFKVPYTETAQSFIKTKWNLKVKVESECRLWIRDRGRGEFASI
jgi:hypothetical protein